MIQVHGKNRIWVYLLSRTNHRLQHPLVGIITSAFGDLKNERSLRINAALKEAENLLQIIDVIRANRVLRVSKPIQSGGRHNHGWNYRRDSWRGASGFWSSRLGRWSTQALKESGTQDCFALASKKTEISIGGDECAAVNFDPIDLAFRRVSDTRNQWSQK